MPEVLKIEFLFDREDMTDEEYDNQEETEVILTESDIREMLAKKLGVRSSDICTENFFMNLVHIKDEEK